LYDAPAASNYAAGYGAPAPPEQGAQAPAAAGPSEEVAAPYEPGSDRPYVRTRREIAEPQSEDAVVLVFRDGRAPEQIHNYMLTRTTLYVQDGRGREIPLDEIDLAATQRLNGDVGVEFRPPDAVR